MTPAQYRSLTPKKKGKYSSRINVVDGIKFRSVKEANYYGKAKLRVRAGLITNLRLQVPYELNAGGTHSVKYYADFVFVENGVEKIIDTKGYRTREYLKKKRLMKKVHGIIIVEV